MKLIDLGISAKDNERISDGMGTSDFAPNDQRSYFGSNAARHFDTYGAAATLVYLLTRKNLSQGGLEAVRDPALRSVLTKALSHEATERYQTAEAFRAALLPFVSLRD